MTQSHSLDANFLEKQRVALLRLQDELVAATQTQESEEGDINADSQGVALEFEDDAQRLAMLELDGNRVARDVQRLAQVRRALEKIAQGSYGRSDASGEAIERQRLEAMPEAVLTAAEQSARESS